MPGFRLGAKSCHNSIRRLTRPPGYLQPTADAWSPLRAGGPRPGPAAGHVQGRHIFGGRTGGLFPCATYHSPNTICHFPPATFWSHCFLSLERLLHQLCLPRCYTLSKQDLRHRPVAGGRGRFGSPVPYHLQGQHHLAVT